jgi:peptidoglycan L-alanyl-D-glutamate endopeptidase CwlK
VAKIELLLAAMSALGWPMRVTDGVRTVERQQALYAQGRTAPGPIVTNADGVTHLSNHQVKPDGFGHAVDLAFVGIDPYLEHDPRGRLRWNVYGAIVQAQGLTWGGNWPSSLLDEPHAEMPWLPPSKGPQTLAA